MKVVDHIAAAQGKTLFSFEILPPLKGTRIDELFGSIERLMAFGPKFVDVTSHREEFIYKKRENGLLEKIHTRKRPGTVGICAAIQNQFKVDTVPHVICGGFTREETEYALIDLHYLGIDNVLVLRGDALRAEGAFKAEANGHPFALDLLKQVVDLNHGHYLHDEVENSNPSNFCIGVAGYPEKHFEAPSLNTDIKHLKAKVDAGAEYIVTQMFFDNQYYFDFVEKCRKSGINVPIIPGLKPIATANQLATIPRNFHLNLPDDLVDAVEAAKVPAAVKEVGIEWCIAQSKELMKEGAPVLHYYTMGKSDATEKIAAALF
ncbi:MAG: methylenetetrahydrofolate reductase [NAD(P)H] [Schleiferiaceae bacterium]|nr:methylenetetrahydrofolate reductase [NAD(P)H] [Schleiferiaceae bacterium]